ncbi:MAG: NAD(P)H-hydrate dehydratase [Candidatus Micrarchaeales archaeon]
MQSLKGLSKAIIANDNDIRKATMPLDMHGNKYSHGRVLVIGGSFEWRGATTMASFAANSAIAALRTVSGFVTVAAPKDVLVNASIRSPVFVLEEMNGKVDHDIKKIDSIRHDAVVVGPGIQKKNMSSDFLKRLTQIEKRKENFMIIDAAMIGFLAEKKDMISSNMVLTPHTGEFFQLTGIDLKKKNILERIKTAKEFAAKYGCVILLKGHETIITDGKRVKVNIAKTPALATMGSGDVLCGIIASYIASHKDPFESAVAGAHLHSTIGDMLFKRKGAHIIATDIIDAIPDVLKRFDVIK